jgi:ubiquinone/menaquinone biosynthesis C-methylase UbiE
MENFIKKADGRTKMRSVKNHQSLMDYYDDKNVVNAYERKRFRSTFGALQHEIELGIVNDAIDALKNPKVLEIAVGTGRVTRDIKVPGVGVDASENMISQAKKAAPQWKFIKKDVMKLDFKNEFDIVVTFRLLRHFDKKARKKSLGLIHKSLKKDGLLIFDMPTGLHSRVLEFLDGFRKKDYIYEDDTPINDLKEELKESGFEAVSVYNTKNENLFFRLLCFLDDYTGWFYKGLKKSMTRLMKDYRSAVNVVVVARKKG